jgi:hypothetical protein
MEASSEKAGLLKSYVTPIHSQSAHEFFAAPESPAQGQARSAFGPLRKLVKVQCMAHVALLASRDMNTQK